MRKVHKRGQGNLIASIPCYLRSSLSLGQKVSAILIWANWLILFTRLPTTGLPPMRSHTIIRNNDHDDNLDHHDHHDHHDGHQCRRGLFASSLPSVKSEWPAQRLERLLPCVRVLQSSAFGANGAVRTSTSIHLHLAQPYVICSISYELLTEESGEKRNGSNGLFFTKQSIAHTHILHLICIKILIPVFFCSKMGLPSALRLRQQKKQNYACIICVFDQIYVV